MSELLKNRETKKERLKELLKQIHAGKKVDELKDQFKEVLSNLSPLEIPLIEQELVKEGISTKEIAKMCDLHVELFRSAISGGLDLNQIPPGHPLHTLYRENDLIIRDTELLSFYAHSLASLEEDEKKQEMMISLRDLVDQLKEIGKTHYTREEMLIFPYLERRGLTAVPTVLWTKHDENRYAIKGLARLLTQEQEISWVEFVDRLKKRVANVATGLIDMVFRENNIFYPTIYALLREGEWVAIKEQEEIFGYYKFKPENKWQPSVRPIQPYEVEISLSAEQILSLPQEVQLVLRGQRLEPDQQSPKKEGDWEVDIGFLSPREISEIFKTLPLEVSFIDQDDRVKFFSKNHQIFARSKSVIGRPVQFCHPPKSVYLVERILKAFKEGKRDLAEFWLNFGGRIIYIRYFPVRDDQGNYLGTIEVVQDVTAIKKLEGEKRLLDWK
ncbi:MAG: DUF438 domain-containing protein [Candidatus Aminicenantes bacterium]|nr:DUF438 domain-containing protein [Candidatus Aminicenantes bacterium]